MAAEDNTGSADKLIAMVFAKEAADARINLTVTALKPIVEEVVIITANGEGPDLCECRILNCCKERIGETWNSAISHNNSSWLLLVYAGESMAVVDHPRLQHLIRHPIRPAYELMIWNGSAREYQLRLLPPYSGIRFNDEYANLSLAEETSLRCRPLLCNITIDAAARAGDYPPTFTADELPVQIAQHLVEKQADDWRSIEVLTNALLARRRLKEALPLLRRGIRLCPRYAPFHSALGYSLMEMGLLSEAHAVLRRAITMIPGYSQLWLNLGVVWLRSGNIKRAVAALTQALELKPDDALTHFNIATCLLKLGRYADAQQHLEQALYHNPDNIQAHAALGMVLLSQGQIPAARARLEEALQLDPTNCSVMYNLGILYRNTGQRSKAIKLWKRLLKLHTQSPEARQLLRDVAELRTEHSCAAGE